MSKRKIKTRRKRPKPKLFNWTNNLELVSKRAQIHDEHVNIIEKLIAEDKLDPYRIEDYKYLRQVAQEAGLSIGILRKTIDSMDINEYLEDKP